MIVDSHCHLNFDDFGDDIADIVQRAKDNSVCAMLNAGSDMNDLETQLELCEKYPFIYTAVGVHPHNAKDYESVKAQDIIQKTEHKKVVAIGETGLDYYYDLSPRDLQKNFFYEHIIASQETGLPLIIHAREADEDIIEMLKQGLKEKEFGAVIHSFSSSKKLADFAVEHGFYLSASGMITFNKSVELRDIFKDVPLHNLLVETDAPYLAPVPKRGCRNEPAFVIHTLEKLAQIKDVPYEQMAQITTDNFFKLFRKASDKGRYLY